MLDIKFVRENVDKIRRMLIHRKVEFDLERLLTLDIQRREYIKQIESLQHERNTLAKQAGTLKQQGIDISDKIEEGRILLQRIRELEDQLDECNNEMANLMDRLPNIPHSDVPIGGGAGDNLIIRQVGKQPVFRFNPLPHWEIAENLGLIDFKRSGKISGQGFALLTGTGAKLQRALINFMLDLHIKNHGYRELYPPYLVKRECMYGTAQLPNLEDDMYCIEKDDLFLIPTAEVPVTNYHRGEILREDQLPLKYVSYTACFRREAGSYGRETKGLTRIHQFDKVELVKFTTPQTSYQELESLVNDAEDVFKLLGLPYRVVQLCTAELSFAAAKCYDIEVWAPGMGKWLECSSCSNFEDFQARRAGIRFKTSQGKTRYLHTLNGSGVALPRTYIALLENYQQEDGTVRIPEVLQPYMDGMDRIGGE